MAGQAKTPRDQFFEDMGRLSPSVALPGYWETLGQNSDQWAADLSVSPFWRSAGALLDRWRQEYRDRYGADLLSRPGLPRFSAKPLDSIKDKLWRKHNARQDFAPLTEQAAPVPNIGDIVRTRIVCRYLDGVEFLADKLEELAKSMASKPQRERQGKLEGYFAQHVNFNEEVLYRSSGHSVKASVTCEIQIATDFATKMWDETHALYEIDRQRAADTPSWQWAPDDPRFIANQLGHMMHLADGLLVQLRARSSDKER